MSPEELRRWTFELAVRAIALVRKLPKGVVEWRLGTQLVDSASSVPAQYRAACRAQSTKDFVAKIKKLEEEADESALWLALLRVTGLPGFLKADSEALESEFSRITAIAVSSAKTARSRLLREKEVRRAKRQRSSP